MGYYWLNMNKDAATVQEECQKCRLSVDKEESYVVFVTQDWRNTWLKGPYQLIGHWATRSRNSQSDTSCKTRSCSKKGIAGFP